jgi:hypothetical protein
MRFILWMHLPGLLLLAGCAPSAPALDAIGEGYVRVALQMAQHDPDLVEDWRGDESWRPGPRVPVAGLLERVDELSRELEGRRPGQARHSYLAAQLRALQFAGRRLMGEPASIDDQARDEFGVVFSRITTQRVAEVHDAIGDVLSGPEPLLDRIAAFKARTVIPTDRRQGVLDAALAACRQATSTALPLPADELVSLSFRRGLGWDGYARYAGNHRTNIEINDDGPLDVARALRLACHEGYPGHHVQYLLIDKLPWPELKLFPAFGPHLLYTEGAAEAGAALALSFDAQVALMGDQLLPLAGLNAGLADALVRVDALTGELLPVVTEVARQYLAGTLAKDAAIERLRTDALLPNPEGTLAMIERRRARALVYGEGRRQILGQMESAGLPALHALFTRATAVQ